jgi:tRNA threonylcarbamoyladenosine biosynthesis protein TsaE
MKVKKESLPELARETLELLKPAQHRPIGSGEPRPGVVSASATAERAAIVALRGDLGAGKTTFTQALARELGINDAVQSPTYVLMKSYPIDFGRFKKLIHIDAYRLDKPEEFSALEPETFLNDPENLVVIEWPERVEGMFPTPDLLLNFTHTDSEEERHIEIEK